MKKNSNSIQKTVTKLAKNKQAKQTDKESAELQKLGDKMSAPNDKAAKS